MADNVTVDNGALTDYVASTEEVTTLNGGAVAAQHVQRMLLAVRSADATAVDLPADSANGLDVDVTRVQGTVAVSGPLTDAQLRASAVPVSGALTDAQLRATAVPVSGTVAADIEGDSSDFDTGAGTDSHGVIGIALPAAGGHVVGGTTSNPVRTDPTGTTTQPVSGPLTDAQLRAASVPVSDGGGSLTVDGTVGVSGTVPVSGPLTDAQLRAASVPVDSELPAAAALADATANPSAPAVGAHGLLWNGATWDRARSPKLADFDTGAGTDNVPMWGIALPKSGGAVAGGTTTDPLQVNLATRLSSDIDTISLEGKIATYAGADYVGAVATAATDVFVLGGSASKTIKVWYVRLFMYATTSGIQLVTLHKRSTADTGGTSAAIARVPLDSTDAASAADVVFRKYTANPTVGADLGIFAGIKPVCPDKDTPATGTLVPVEWDFSKSGRRPIVLRGTNEQAAINCEGSILAGLEMTAEFVWTEE